MKATDNMELDELKKAWNMLDEQLRKEDIVNENQLSELITKHKTGAKNSIRRLRRKQRFALWFGGSMIVLFIVSFLFIIPAFISDSVIRQKANLACFFLILTLVGGIWWDFKTYKWIRDTRIDEMPVIEVIQRISKFRLYMKYEVIGISIWVITLTVFYYLEMNLWKVPVLQQFIFILVLLSADILIIYILYKKLIYNSLNDAEMNLKELKELQKTQ